jgi:hypothetical protein
LSVFIFSALIIPALSSAAVTMSHVTVEDKDDFVIEPAKIEVFANPGETVTRSISVTSRIKAPTAFRLNLEDFIGTDEPNNPLQLLGNDKSPYSIKDNLTPDASEFTLNFGDKITIPIQIKIPDNAAPGGFYTSVLVSNAPSKENTESYTTGAKVVSRAGALLFIRVNGEAQEEGHIDDFRITPHHFIYQPGNFTFETLFVNSGNVHLAPYGTIEVKNIFGTVIGSANVDAYYSLPHSTRYRQIEIDGHKWFGYYRATVSLNKSYHNPDQEGQLDERTISFFVIPWMFLIIFFVALFIIISILLYVRNNFDIRKK